MLCGFEIDYSDLQLHNYKNGPCKHAENQYTKDCQPKIALLRRRAHLQLCVPRSERLPSSDLSARNSS